MPFIPEHIVNRLNAINVEAVAEALGVEVRKHQALCFIHPDHTPSLHFHPGKNIWKCFVCNEGGTPISLVMKHRGVGFVEACQWLSGVFGIHIPGNNRPPIHYKRQHFPASLKKKYLLEERCQPTFNADIAQWVLDRSGLSPQANDFLFIERKLSEEVVAQLNIKSISSCFNLAEMLREVFPVNSLVEAGYLKSEDSKTLRLFTPCLLFPYYDIDGNLIGLQSRYLGNHDGPRFQYLSGFKPSFFNIGITKSMGKGDDLYIAEGVTDCMALLSEGYKAVAFPGAQQVPLDHLNEVLNFNLIMSVDREESGAGQRAYNLIKYNVIKKGGKLRKLDFPKEYKDYGEYFKNKG